MAWTGLGISGWRITIMKWDDPDVNYIRLAATALPVLAGILALAVLDRIGHDEMAILWGLAAVSLLWMMARFRHDILAERRRLKLLSEEQRKAASPPSVLTQIVDGMADPLLLLDRRRQVAQANRAARELLGAAIVGRDISFYLRHPAVLEAIDGTLDSGLAAEREFTLLDPVERTCLARTGIIEMEDGGETQRYVLLSIYDLTKIKLAEKMRADFVANASHELRTPLASILGFIETLSGPAAKDAEARARFLKIMGEEAGRMQRLIEDLLSLSRIEMDQHLAPSGSVEIAALLKGLADTTMLRAGKSEPVVTLNLPAAPPPVRGDRDQLLQVFQNLLDNALKYGRPGEPVEITVNVVERLPNRNTPGLAVCVSNKGDGIPAEHIPRLTERFYRVDPARSRKLGGTGLGLAIVKHIVTRHRGALVIESELGQGTRVTVYLPLALVQAAA